MNGQISKLARIHQLQNALMQEQSRWQVDMMQQHAHWQATLGELRERQDQCSQVRPQILSHLERITAEIVSLQARQQEQENQLLECQRFVFRVRNSLPFRLRRALADHVLALRKTMLRWIRARRGPRPAAHRGGRFVPSVASICAKDAPVDTQARTGGAWIATSGRVSHLMTEFARRFIGRLLPPPTLRPEVCLVGCVAENNDKYLRQTVRFVQAIRWFGGSLAGVRIRVCVVDDIEPAYARRLERLDADVRIVHRFHPRNPYANKLQFFNQLEWNEAEMVMLLDCDTAVVRDPLPFITSDAFQAKIADLPSVSHEVFTQIFNRYGLTLPKRSHVTDFNPTPTIPYCNSGVLFIPAQIGRRLIPAWRDWNIRLADNLEILGPYACHCDQASLAVALAETGVPFRPVDRALNYPLHLTHMPAPAGFAESDPVVIHYHDRIDAEGFLLPTPYPKAQVRIAALNARSRPERSRPSPVGPSKPRKTELLITGIPRSGTSYLCNLLHRYDNCVVLNEPSEVIGILRRHGVPHDLRRFFDSTRRKVQAGEPVENKLTCGKVTEDTALNDVRSLYQPHPRTPEFVLGVKNTRAFLSRLEGIRQVMGAARIVACVRNPVDTIASWKNSFPHLRDADVVGVPVGHVEDPWLSDADKVRLREIADTTDAALRRALWWRHFAEIILRNRQHLLVVRYCEFVREPAVVLERILENYDPRQLIEPIPSSEARRTGGTLNQREQDLIRAVCTKAARELGVLEES
jgi:hypothetical protein